MFVYVPKTSPFLPHFSLCLSMVRKLHSSLPTPQSLFVYGLKTPHYPPYSLVYVYLWSENSIFPSLLLSLCLPFIWKPALPPTSQSMFVYGMKTPPFPPYYSVYFCLLYEKSALSSLLISLCLSMVWKKKKSRHLLIKSRIVKSFFFVFVNL